MQKAIISGVLVLGLAGLFYFTRSNEQQERPCRKLGAACESAGFRRGNTPEERRAFQEQCMRPLMENLEINGVRVDEKDVEACRERQSRRRGGNREQGGEES